MLGLESKASIRAAMPKRRTIADLLDDLNEHWPEVASPESEIALAVIRLNGLVRYRMEEQLRARDLTPAAFEVLVTLRSLPPPRRLTPTEIYRANLLSSGGLTKILGTLSGRGLIELAANSADGRSKTVRLTAKGKRFVETAAKDVSAQDRALFADKLDPKQILHLRTALLGALATLEGA